MTTDPQRRGLLADLTRHLAPLSLDALRIVGEFALGLLQVEREQPIVLESLARQIVRFDPREPERLAIQAAIQLIGLRLREEDGERAERHEKARDEMVPRRPVCSTCEDTHAMDLNGAVVMCTRCPVPCESCRQRDPGVGSGAYCAMTPCACRCHAGSRTADIQIGMPGDNWGGGTIVVDVDDPASEFRADRRTEISPVPETIARTMTPALDEDPEPYDSLELEWDVSDIHAGEGT